MTTREMKNMSQQKQPAAWDTVASDVADTPLGRHSATAEAEKSPGQSFHLPKGHERPVTPLARHRRARQTLDSEPSGGWLWSLG